MENPLGLLMVAIGLPLFWIATLGRKRADPNLLGHVGLLGLLLSVIPARWWPPAVLCLGSVIVVLNLAVTFGFGNG